MTTEDTTTTGDDPSSTVDTDADNPEAGLPLGSDPDEASDEAIDSTDREAAKYRRRLREAEADRDRLASVVETYQRKEAETAATGLASGSDLWLAGVALGDLLDADGQVDPAKVQETVAGIVKDRPHWARRLPSFDGGPRTSPPAQKGWADVIGGAGR